MLSFSQVVGIGTPPTPLRRRVCPPPRPRPPGSGGRGTLAGERGVGGESQFRRGTYTVVCSTLYKCISTLCHSLSCPTREGGLPQKRGFSGPNEKPATESQTYPTIPCTGQGFKNKISDWMRLINLRKSISGDTIPSYSTL